MNPIAEEEEEDAESQDTPGDGAAAVWRAMQSAVWQSPEFPARCAMKRVGLRDCAVVWLDRGAFSPAPRAATLSDAEAVALLQVLLALGWTPLPPERGVPRPVAA